MIKFDLKLLIQILQPTIVEFNSMHSYKDKTLVYTFPMTGQTAGPNGLKFFVDTLG